MDEYWIARALRFLQIRPRSEKEIIDYLTKKNVPEKTIEGVLQYLKEKKYVNDTEFAHWWVDQRTRVKPKGKRFIAIELQQKGIARDIIDASFVSEGEPILSDKEKAVKILEKKKSRFEKMEKQERFQKAG